MTASILRGDARALPLPDASVDLIVTSPPYWALRSYQDGGEHYAGQIGAEASPVAYVDALIECTREWMRVLKPSGSIVVNLGDKYSTRTGRNGGRQGSTGQRATRKQAATYTTPPDLDYGAPAKCLLLLPERYRIACVDELGLIARAVVIWSKPNGLPESVTDRVRRSHEDWVHLTKAPHYYSAVDEIREPHSDTSPHALSRRARTDARLTAAGAGATSAANPLGKLPGSVWTIAGQPLRVPAALGIEHFAAFPMEWPRRLVKAWSPHGGTVLDPFGGTGTTALVASALGRHGISIDASADYCRLAQWRTTDPAERARVIGGQPPRALVDGEVPLFEEGALP